MLTKLKTKSPPNIATKAHQKRVGYGRKPGQFARPKNQPIGSNNKVISPKKM